MSFPFSTFERAQFLTELAERAYCEENPEVKYWILAASLSPSQRSMAVLERYLSLQAAQARLQDGDFRPISNEARPRIPIGLGFDQLSGRPVAIDRDKGASHILIGGGTGTGKTTLAQLIALQMAETGVKIIFVERDKSEARGIAEMIGATVINIAEDWPCNLLAPLPGLSPRQSIRLLGTCMARSFGWMVLSYYHFVKEVYAAYRQNGVFEGSTNYPSLGQIEQRFLHKKVHPGSRAGNALQTILSRVSGMRDEVPQCYDYVRGISYEKLVSNHLVIETGAISHYHARLRLLHLCLGLHLQRQSLGGNGGILRNLFIFDEASWFAPAMESGEEKQSLLNSVVSQTRASGLGFLFGTQSIKGIDETVLENTATKVAMRLGDGRCSSRIGESMSLSPYQRARIPLLKTGEAIASLESYPILMRVPDIYSESRS